MCAVIDRNDSVKSLGKNASMPNPALRCLLSPFFCWNLIPGGGLQTKKLRLQVPNPLP
jgi:hypothetical protein